MKTTTTNAALYMIRSIHTHEVLSAVALTKGRVNAIIKATGRTDLEMVRVNW